LRAWPVQELLASRWLGVFTKGGLQDPLTGISENMETLAFVVLEISSQMLFYVIPILTTFKKKSHATKAITEIKQKIKAC